MIYTCVVLQVYFGQESYVCVYDKMVSLPIRSCLPAPMFSRNDFSIWSILKKCIGLVRTCFIGKTMLNVFSSLAAQFLW